MKNSKGFTLIELIMVTIILGVLAAVAVLAKLGLMAKNPESLTLQLGDGLPLGEGLGHGLAVHLVELGLVVKGLEVRGSARHAEKNHPLGLCQHG